MSFYGAREGSIRHATGKLLEKAARIEYNPLLP
jgi:hypothetical protein